MSLARAFLDVTGFLNVFFGLVYLVDPARLTEPAGLRALDPTALTDIRAIYGGLQLGWGVFQIWCARAPRHYEAGLVCTAVMCAGLAGCRWIGVGLAGGVSWVDQRALWIESGYTLLTVWIWLRFQRAARSYDPLTQHSASS